MEGDVTTCLPIQTLRSGEAGNEDLAMVMREFLHALAHGQVNVLTTGCAAEPRTEPILLADTDRARLIPGYAKHSEHLVLVTEQFERTTHHPKPSGTPPESITLQTDQLAQLRRLHAEALAISDALAGSLAHAAAAGTETVCSGPASADCCSNRAKWILESALGCELPAHLGYEPGAGIEHLTASRIGRETVGQVGCWAVQVRGLV